MGLKKVRLSASLPEREGEAGREGGREGERERESVCVSCECEREIHKNASNMVEREKKSVHVRERNEDRKSSDRE